MKIEKKKIKLPFPHGNVGGNKISVSDFISFLPEYSPEQISFTFTQTAVQHHGERCNVLHKTLVHTRLYTVPVLQTCSHLRFPAYDATKSHEMSKDHTTA